MMLPGTFMRTTSAVHRDIGLIRPRIEAMCDSAVDMVPVDERAELSRFLEGLLAATPSVREHA